MLRRLKRWLSALHQGSASGLYCFLHGHHSPSRDLSNTQALWCQQTFSCLRSYPRLVQLGAFVLMLAMSFVGQKWHVVVLIQRLFGLLAPACLPAARVPVSIMPYSKYIERVLRRQGARELSRSNPFHEAEGVRAWAGPAPQQVGDLPSASLCRACATRPWCRCSPLLCQLEPAISGTVQARAAP